MTTDNVTLTVEPQLQNAAWQALTTLPPGANKDGAVVVIQPSTGNILAMVSNPTFDPNPLASTSLQAEQLAYYSYIQKDHEGFFPLRPIANRETFPPGSTMKVVTSTAAYNLKPALAGFNYPGRSRASQFSDSNKILCNDGSTPSNSTPCGGTMAQMLPVSCDPGYAELGVQLGVPIMTKQSELFGYNSVPGIDLPGTSASIFPPLAPNSQAFLGQSSIGQYNVQTTALQNAMVAAGIANGGVLMTPHLMSSIHDSQGALVQTYTPKAASTVASAQTAQQVTSLMEGVVASGTASGRRLPRLPVRRGQDRNGADRPDHRPDRHLDDRLCAGQQPPGGRGGGRAAAGQQLRRRQRRRADHERRPASRRAAVARSAALQRAAGADLGLHVRPLRPAAVVRRSRPEPGTLSAWLRR